MVGGTFKSRTGETVVMLGLSKGNLDRLQDGKPMALKQSTHDFVPKGMEILIFSGETEDEMTQDLVKLGLLDVDTIIDRRGEKVPIGSTGEFPDGKLGQHDEGELRIAMTVWGGQVIVKFGKPVGWLGLPPEKAIEMARLLTERANEILKARGVTS